MVLTAVGSVTALFGVCVMAAIFQCCCRKKRRNRLSGQDLLKNQKDEGAVSKRSRSKSPSPQKVPEIKEDKVERRQVEQDKLVEEDDDLGDFSLVQRETEILRSYRKPPPPKNRARASRVPRALKTVDPKENPNALKDLVEQEEKELKQTAKKANGVTSPDNQQPSTGMHPSMLDDIDSTIAALHVKPDGGKKELSKSPSKGSSDRSREPSEEKVLGTETETSSSQSQPQLPKPNGKDQLSSALSREELAKSLAKELSKATSKEGLEKPLSKSVPPKPQRTDSPKSHSAGASPKLKGKGKDALVTKSQDNVSDAESRRGNEGTPMSLEGENTGRREVQNVFALIDPTVGGGSSVERDKSKIPVRASSSPTQPTAPLRPASGKDYKRFPHITN
nr:hypothetical protein BaRGS_024608 [Batillaria attramentaria]